MESPLALAARVGDIAPFHVMEVQTAARALEAAGRSVVHMEIGEPDFPTPGPVLDAARRALVDGGIYYTSALGLPELRAAIARPLCGSPGRCHRPRARHRHRGIVGCAVAGDCAPRRPRRRSPAGRSRRIRATAISSGSSKGAPIGIPVGPETRYQLSAASIEQAWTRTHARRADRVAVESDRHAGCARRNGEDRGTVARRGGSLVVDEIYLASPTAGRRAPRSRRPACTPTTSSSYRASPSTST